MQEIYQLSVNLKQLREYHFTLKEVAEKLGITYQSYHAYEKGLTVPTLQNFIKLAHLYEVSLDEIVKSTFGLPTMAIKGIIASLIIENFCGFVKRNGANRERFPPISFSRRQRA